MTEKLHYKYKKSQAFCEQIGLVWLGDDFVRASDAEAFKLKFTQKQVDAAMRHHLWQVKFLFTPTTYPYLSRIKLAFMFLTGFTGKK